MAIFSGDSTLGKRQFPDILGAIDKGLADTDTNCDYTSLVRKGRKTSKWGPGQSGAHSGSVGSAGTS